MAKSRSVRQISAMMKPMPRRNLYAEAQGGGAGPVRNQSLTPAELSAHVLNSDAGLGDICMVTPTTEQHRRIAARASKTGALARAKREAENQ